MKTPDFYIVATMFPRLGFGCAGGDVQEDRDAAYDEFAACRDEDQPVRVFLAQFDVDTNLPETFADVTDLFEADYQGFTGIAAE